VRAIYLTTKFKAKLISIGHYSKMKFKDLANGMVFQFAFDQRFGVDWWYTKYDDLNTVCVKSTDGKYVGRIDYVTDDLQEEEVILATKFSA
jgi:hypothetical protein